jgi:hypothetical protein
MSISRGTDLQFFVAFHFVMNRFLLLSLLAIAACGKRHEQSVPLITRGPGDTSLYGNWQLAYSQNFVENGVSWTDLLPYFSIVLNLSPTDSTYTLRQNGVVMATGNFHIIIDLDTALFLEGDTSRLIWADSHLSSAADTLYLSSYVRLTLPQPIDILERGKQP